MLLIISQSIGGHPNAIYFLISTPQSMVRGVDQIEISQTIRGRGRGTPRKIVWEVIKKDLEIHNLDKTMILDRTL